ncbi:MAG: tRNA 4-thiouridine(8) synthase ThiI [Lachnospiraceae bacterium]|nr:tRNA 4-thiouridine(8) synthase ThiI [Lachnospiraceae bacterium]MDD7702109.1 tRNA 4-thiouridine(8) synthase ThiI [Lachnospiraceae bacterium]MDY3302261.1 tRNA uracil 4-sulfurtransferase ThiI [Lachnospiraceae bacterium]
MYQAFVVKYGEIGIKGKNRAIFEDALIHNIVVSLKNVEGKFLVEKEQGRVYVEAQGEFDYEEALTALERVFGIVEICPAVLTEDKGFDVLADEIMEYIDETYAEKNFTFKVFAKRARKNYPLDSMTIAREMGGRILEKFPSLQVDVHEPQVSIHIEIRERISFYSESFPGAGGMPVGTNGRAMLLLSGGIDSPVAGHMIAKRGVAIDATYFHAPPYTSERAKQKVVDLAKIVARYSGPIRLHIINFTDIQLAIYEKCPHDELTIIMRRIMMYLAEHFAKEDGDLGLVTGESIGQVASQTMSSMFVTNDAATMPVYRPLVGFDKQEIIERSIKIGTYDTSILPYEDCCTIFVAKHPVTKPRLDAIKRSESKLDEVLPDLMKAAIDSTETIWVKAED